MAFRLGGTGRLQALLRYPEQEESLVGIHTLKPIGALGIVMVSHGGEFGEDGCSCISGTFLPSLYSDLSFFQRRNIRSPGLYCTRYMSPTV